ncbi:MAG: DNA methyltransferase [Bacteroidota bacterium]
MTESGNIHDSNIDLRVDGTFFKGKVNFDFEELLPPVPTWARDQVEPRYVSIRKVDDPIILWEKIKDAEYVLIGGRLAYEIACDKNLPFEVIVRHFANKDEVKRFILEQRLLHEYISDFQKGVLVLKYKDLLISQGKKNMSKGGKGFQISEKDKINTWEYLANLAGYSRSTLWQVDKIIKNLQDVEIWRKLTNGEIRINKVYENFNGWNKESVNDNLKITNAKYYIDERCKYQVVYIHPKWNLSNQISNHNRFIEDLMSMNIDEITYDKFSTLFLQFPSKYIGETFEMIRLWGFNVTDLLTVKHESILYDSEFAEQVHENLFICKKNNNGAPIRSTVSKLPSVIAQDQVFSYIETLYPEGYCKLTVFTGARSGWESYDFDKASNSMVLQLDNSTAKSQPISNKLPTIQESAERTLRNDFEKYPSENRSIDLIPYLETNNGKLFHGDVLDVLRTLPDASVDLINTSPPYNLHSHHKGNKKIRCYSDHMPEDQYQAWQLEVLQECFRILKPTGSLLDITL